MDEDEIEDVATMVSIARGIVQSDVVFDIRRRYNTNHPEEDKKQEQLLHDTLQKKAWDKVKEFFCDNRGDVLVYRIKASSSDKGLIDAIDKVIENEIDSIILDP